MLAGQQGMSINSLVIAFLAERAAVVEKEWDDLCYRASIEAEIEDTIAAHEIETHGRAITGADIEARHARDGELANQSHAQVRAQARRPSPEEIEELLKHPDDLRPAVRENVEALAKHDKRRRSQ